MCTVDLLFMVDMQSCGLGRHCRVVLLNRQRIHRVIEGSGVVNHLDQGRRFGTNDCSSAKTLATRMKTASTAAAQETFQRHWEVLGVILPVIRKEAVLY